MHEFLAEPPPSPPRRDRGRRRSSVDLETLQSKLKYVRGQKESVDGLLASSAGEAATEGTLPILPQDQAPGVGNVQQAAPSLRAAPRVSTPEERDETSRRQPQWEAPLVLPGEVSEARDRCARVANRLEAVALPNNDGRYARAGRW